jgi:Mrp family chromosome partitioning ATPase
MSRNFEFLYQVGKAQEMLQTTDVEPTAVPLPDFSTSTPALEIEGMARDEVTKLVHRLFLRPGAESPRQVILTGTESGTGCTWICAHAAEILAAQVNRSVCVVDCNLASPSLHHEFRVENHFGLSNSLLEEGPIRQFARQLSRRNLWLLSCGASDENARDLLTSERMRMRMSELRAEFDYVLMDVAPFNVCNHGTVLGGFADGVVLVLKANSSRRDSTWEITQQLQASNVRVLGAVLNQRTFPIPERIYRHL